MKTTKFIMKNINNWLRYHSLQFNTHEKKSSFEQELACFKNTCKLCNKNVEELVLKEAKKEIIGPMHWR